MHTLLSLTKDRDDALKAVASAAGAGARKKALATLESASMALARFKSKLEAKSKARAASKPVADEDDDSDDEDEESEEEEEEKETASDDEPKKPLATKKKAAAAEEEEEEEEEEEDDDSDDDSDDEEEESEEEDSDDDDDDDDDDDSEEEEEEQEEEEARAIALSSARSLVSAARKSKDKASLQAAIAHRKVIKSALAVSTKARSKYRQLKSACSAVTGKKSLAAIIGGVQGLAVAAAQEAKNAADIAKMKATTKNQRVKALLDAAVRDGKITAKSVPLLRAGMPNYKTLKAYLGALPKMVRTVNDGAVEGKTTTGGTDATADKDRAQHLDFQSMSDEQKKFIMQEAQSQGVTVDAFLENMKKVSNKIAVAGFGEQSPLPIKRPDPDIKNHREANGAVGLGR